MLGNKTRPVIGILGIQDAATSSRNPLEFIKIQSPRGLKNYGACGVGLGILAALGSQTEKKAIFSKKEFDPIQPNSGRCGGSSALGEMEKENIMEEYIYVTPRGPNKKSHTRVQYYNGDDYVRRCSKNHRACVFDISPAAAGTSGDALASDFLSSCHLCQKKLHGKDIHMYRGEKAFCSHECRYRQIVMDERKEKYCNSQASTSADNLTNSPHTSTDDHRNFPTGILAI